MNAETKKKIDLFAPIVAFLKRVFPFAFKTKELDPELVKSRFVNKIVAVSSVTVDFVIPVKFFVVGDSKIAYDVTAKNCQLVGDKTRYLLYTSKDANPVTLEISLGDLREAVKKGRIVVKNFVV